MAISMRSTGLLPGTDDATEKRAANHKYEEPSRMAMALAYEWLVSRGYQVEAKAWDDVVGHVAKRAQQKGQEAHVNSVDDERYLD
jgi:hypothetical protein